MENKKQKRFYHKGEFVWAKALNDEVKVVNIDIENKDVTVTHKAKDGLKEHTFKLWEIDKLKYSKKKEREEKKVKKQEKTTYFASVKGGVIPTKEDENGGRDCYARLETKVVEDNDGNEVEIKEIFLPRLQVSTIPLGFASYLDKRDILSINWERSSVGKLGLLVTAGLIDSTYQGEVMLQVVPLAHNILITDQVDEVRFNEADNIYYYPASKAIAQAVVLEQSQAKEKHISYDELLSKPSSRGTQGWGSTGK